MNAAATNAHEYSVLYFIESKMALIVGYILQISEIKYAVWIAICKAELVTQIPQVVVVENVIFWNSEQLLVKFQTKQSTLFSQFTRNSHVFKFNLH